MKALIMKLLMGIGLAAFAEHAFSAIVGNGHYVAHTYYANPHAAETLVAFDWDEGSNLYYSTGRPGYDVGFSVYRYNGSAVSILYADMSAFSGSRVTAIGGRIYFNDGGTYDRWTCDYYRYDPAHPAAPVNIGMLSDIYGLETRDGTDVWAAGGYSAAIYRSALNAKGDLVSNPLVNLGAIGHASGPLAFDAHGNLYYAEGYVAQGHPKVYHWSAEDVAAAIANPTGNPLSPDGHLLTTLTAGDGASGMVVDDRGNLVVTATSFTDPAELHRVLMSDGACVGYHLLARSDERLETVRIRDGIIYVSSSAGIFTVVPGQADKVPVSGDFDGDRKNDPALYQASSGTWLIQLSADGYSTVPVALGGSNELAIPKDFDGDGKTDPAVYNERTGAWRVWMSADGYEIASLAAFGGPGYAPVIQDFDGDGKADPGVYHEASGRWEVKMSGKGYAGETLSDFGGTGYRSAAMDYDGDGKADPAIYQESTGNLIVQLSGSSYEPNHINLGSAGCQIVAGMYDSDTRADPAVYNSANGNWTVRLSAGAYRPGNLWAFGGADCTPLAADFDGDGLADPAVYNATLGMWGIMLSGNDYAIHYMNQ